MSAMTRLKSIGKVQVGSGLGASAEYPVLSVDERVQILPANEADAGEAYVEISWTMECLAEAAADNQIGALNALLQSSLARREQQVTFTERGGAARVLPAPGAVAGSITGYPRVAVRCVPGELTAGVWQRFTLEAVTRRHVSTSAPVHEFERETSTDDVGRVSVRQSGSVAAPPGFAQSAAAWLETNVLAPARTQAQADSMLFTHSVRSRGDALRLSYTYATSFPQPGQFGAAGPAGVTRGEVSDRTVIEREAGQATRTVSGFFEGPGASIAAELARPAGPGVWVRRREISLPRQPDGRVDFRYEALDGIPVGNVTLFEWSQSLEDLGGGRAIAAATFFNASPTIWRGPEQVYAYRQSTRVRFRGSYGAALALITPALDAGHRSGAPSVSKSSAGGVRSISHDQVFVFAAPQTLPDPVEYFVEP